MEAIVVGGGPVGCLAAVALRGRGFRVTVYERGPDPRTAAPRTGRAVSFNLTLTERGLRALAPALRETLLARGVRCHNRVVHHGDGSTEAQPYGQDGEYLLPLPRGELHRLLTAEAEAAGAELRFGHRCVSADTRTAAMVVLDAAGVARSHTADLLVGCDGAGSTVRGEIVNHGGRLDVAQSFIAHGYVDFLLPPGDGGRHILDGVDAGDPRYGDPRRGPGGLGLHVWPRGGFMLLGQPNRDGSSTLTLFLPLESPDPAVPDFRDLADPGAAGAFLRRHFPDVARHLPDAGTRLAAATPKSLRTVTCGPYHHGRTVLLGDAAHTMPPFFGQGINCSFEDVRTLAAILDDAGGGTRPRPDDVPYAAAEFTARRTGPCHAITELSLAHLDVLSAPADPAAATVARLEEQLHRAHPAEFVPLYTAIAFSAVPYDQVRDTYRRRRQVLDELLTRYDPATQTPTILSEFARLTAVRAARHAHAAPAVERSPV